MRLPSWLTLPTVTTLNRLADSSQRATVLSVKSLAYNLGYAAVSVGYAGLVAWEQKVHLSDDLAFLKSLFWQPIYFAATLSLFFLFVYLTRSKRGSGVSP